MNAAERLREALRQALDDLQNQWKPEAGYSISVFVKETLQDAAEWRLKILEANPELVERIAEVICQEHCGFENEEKVDPDLDAARAVLAAIALEDAG